MSAPLPSFLADAAREQPAFSRAEMMLIGLTQNFHQPQMPVADCFGAVYGDPIGRQFWEAECSEPVGIARFIRLLTVTLDWEEFGNPGKPEVEAQSRNLAIGAALLAAYRAGPGNRVIFSGDVAAFETVKHGWQLPAGIMVNLRLAAECLLAMPKRRHLVPRSLAEFVQGAAPEKTVPVLQRTPQKAVPKAVWQAWLAERGPSNPPTYRQAEAWAEGKNYSVASVRPLVRALRNSPGRRRKNAPL